MPSREYERSIRETLYTGSRRRQYTKDGRQALHGKTKSPSATNATSTHALICIGSRGYYLIRIDGLDVLTTQAILSEVRLAPNKFPASNASSETLGAKANLSGHNLVRQSSQTTEAGGGGKYFRRNALAGQWLFFFLPDYKIRAKFLKSLWANSLHFDQFIYGLKGSSSYDPR